MTNYTVSYTDGRFYWSSYADPSVWGSDTSIKKREGFKMADYGEMVAPAPSLGGVDVRIEKVENGFIVRVGCKTFVAKTWKEASEGIGMYFRDPQAATKKYLKGE